MIPEGWYAIKQRNWSLFAVQVSDAPLQQDVQAENYILHPLHART